MGDVNARKVTGVRLRFGKIVNDTLETADGGRKLTGDMTNSHTRAPMLQCVIGEILTSRVCSVRPSKFSCGAILRN